jgi:hypothetical protein
VLRPGPAAGLADLADDLMVVAVAKDAGLVRLTIDDGAARARAAHARRRQEGCAVSNDRCLMPGCRRTVTWIENLSRRRYDHLVTGLTDPA